jgi:hypothetical protein
MLLAALAAAPGATGLGLDIHEPDVDRAQRAAIARGLADRATFATGDAVDHQHAADLLINLGAHHAFGDGPAAALAALRQRSVTGTRLLFGTEYWSSLPTDDELAHMWPDASRSDCLLLPDLLDLVHASGWRLLLLHDATRNELDDYEIGYRLEREEWLLQHPTDGALRADLDASWSSWLRGHRRPFGFVTMLLGAA